MLTVHTRCCSLLLVYFALLTGRANFGVRPSYLSRTRPNTPVSCWTPRFISQENESELHVNAGRRRDASATASKRDAAAVPAGGANGATFAERRDNFS